MDVMMVTIAPALGILIDLPLGVLMWVTFIRFLFIIFVKEDSRVLPMRILVGFTSPVMALIKFVKPDWMIDRLAPLYAAITLLILRYYLFPLLIGYDVTGFGNMPLEAMVLSVYHDYL
ncbi:hypothetical protein N9W44_03975 [Alphaproteobacteria bacterium]|nr:hypothetical protein [Alphaproteobacteria bacterium]